MESYFTLWIKQSFARTWGWGDSLSGVAGSAIPIVAHFSPIWGEQMSGSLWMMPIFGLAAALLFRLLFAAPHELWRKERERAATATAALADISRARTFQFVSAEFRFNYATPEKGPLAAIRLTHSNKGDHLIAYRLENIWLESDGAKHFLHPSGKTIYQQPTSEGHYDCFLNAPIDLASFPCSIKLNFDYFYDTTPATGERQTGATLRYVITAPERGAPVEGHWFDEQREA